MVTPRERTLWHRWFVYSAVSLSVLLPLVARKVSWELDGNGQEWFNMAVIFVVPCWIALAPILIDLVRRSWIFNVYAIFATWLFALLIGLATSLVCVVTLS
jgi:hypothetical protein